MSFSARLRGLFTRKRDLDPARAYNMLANGYDSQPGNLMLDLDENVFSLLMQEIHIEGKIVADIGCGTGRHWNRIFEKKPQELLGFDVSLAMIEILKEKFPRSTTQLLNDDKLPFIRDKSVDIIVSTLAIAHISNLKAALKEWNRVLKHGGEVIITDYHPHALMKGARRTFKHKGKLIGIKNHIHPIESIRSSARNLGWNEHHFIEKVIDDSVKEYYAHQDAISVFEKFRNVPIIYGIHLKKSNDSE